MLKIQCKVCHFCELPLNHREAWSWQHLANHRDARRQVALILNVLFHHAVMFPSSGSFAQPARPSHSRLRCTSARVLPRLPSLPKRPWKSLPEKWRLVLSTQKSLPLRSTWATSPTGSAQCAQGLRPASPCGCTTFPQTTLAKARTSLSSASNVSAAPGSL